MARVDIRIEDDLLDRFKEYCRSQNKTVSEMLRQFVHTSLNGVHTDFVHTNPVHTNSVCTDESVHTTSVHTDLSVHTPVHTPSKKIIFDPLTGEPLVQ